MVEYILVASTLDELLRRAFAVAATGGIEGLLVWYISNQPREMFRIFLITLAGMLVAAAAENIQPYGRSVNERLRTQRWSFYSFFTTVILFGVTVATIAKSNTDERHTFTLEIILLTLATINTWAFPSAMSAVVNREP